MNKEYKIGWASVAESDLRQILERIAAESPDNPFCFSGARPNRARVAGPGNTHL